MPFTSLKSIESNMSNNNKNYTLMDAEKAEEIVRSNVKKEEEKILY